MTTNDRLPVPDYGRSDVDGSGGGYGYSLYYGSSWGDGEGRGTGWPGYGGHHKSGGAGSWREAYSDGYGHLTAHDADEWQRGYLIGWAHMEHNLEAATRQREGR